MQKHTSLHFGLTLSLSYGIPVSGLFIDQAFRWTNTLHGLSNGIVFAFLFSFLWALLFLPWCLCIYGFFRWRPSLRYRTHIALAPSVLLLCYGIGTLIFQPPTPQRRLKEFAGAEMPPSATHLRYYFSGGGFADYSDTYSFTCSPTDTERLIAEMKLAKDDSYTSGTAGGPFRILPDAPDYRKWKGATLYQRHDEEGERHDEEGLWFYYLLASSDRTMVYIHIGCF